MIPSRQESFTVALTARDIVEKLRSLDPELLERTIAFREKYEQERVPKDDTNLSDEEKTALRCMRALTHVLKLLLFMRGEILAIDPPAEDARVAANVAIKKLGLDFPEVPK